MKIKIQHTRFCRKQVMQSGKFKALNAYIRKKKKSQISNLSSHISTQGKINQSKQKEKIKVRAEISEIENRKTKGKSRKGAIFFFN